VYFISPYYVLIFLLPGLEFVRTFFIIDDPARNYFAFSTIIFIVIYTKSHNNGRLAKYIFRTACLLVCLCVCLLAYLKNYTVKLHIMFCTCYLWPWIGPTLTTVQYNMYFRFCGLLVNLSPLMVENALFRYGRCGGIKHRGRSLLSTCTMACLEEPTLEILYGAKTVFTRSAITPPKVNRFG